jgi:RimJ/RimL family protein N-acetyltransferase
LLDSVDDFLTKVYNPIATSDADLLWAIVDKTRPAGEGGTHANFAGVLSLNDTRPDLAYTELGGIVFPAFQRSHVASNAIGLALLFLMDPPSQQGLGLRRVMWQANAKNTPSRRVATRMGFTLEGILRWHRVFPPNRASQAEPGIGVPTAALAARNGTKPEDEAPGRHTAIFSIVWDEWEEKRQVVVTQMGRWKSL